MKEKEEHSFLQVHLPLLLVQICFASLPAYSKISFRAFGPEALSLLRIWTAAILFSSIFFSFRKEKIKDKKHYLYFAMLGFFGATGNIFFFLKGVQFSTAINASIIVTTIPVMTILTAVIMRQEKFSISKMAGVITAFSGVAVLMNIGSLEMGEYLKGNLFLILNSFLYAVYLVLIKPMMKHYKPFTIITYVFLFSAIEIIPLSIGKIAGFNFTAVPLESYFPLGMVLVVGTIFPYLLNTFALKHAPSSLVAVYIYLQPVFASFLAVMLLGEVITLKIIIAAILIIFGVTIVRFPNILYLGKKKEG